MRTFIVLVALLGALPLHCAAAPFAVQLGDTRIGLDAPPGFSDTGFTGSPRLQELGEALTSASNRILLFAISDADLRRFTVGDPPEFRRYMIIVTPRGMERERVTESSFKRLVADSMRDLGPAPPQGDLTKYLDSRPVGASNLLAELRKDADVVSLLQGARIKASSFRERAQYMVSSSTLMLVRGKALSLAVYTRYDDPADVEWLRSTTARWIDELQRLNSR